MVNMGLASNLNSILVSTVHTAMHMACPSWFLTQMSKTKIGSYSDRVVTVVNIVYAKSQRLSIAIQPHRATRVAINY